MADGKFVSADAETNTAGLASILGLTGRRVQQLRENGILIPVRKGVFYVGDSVQRYMAYATNARNLDDEAKDADKRKLVAEAKYKEAKATRAQLEAEELKGKMHRAEDVELIVGDMIYSIKSALNSLPSRLALEVENLPAAEVEKKITVEVHAIELELSQYEYSSDKYTERVRERMQWSSDNLEEGDDDDAE